MKTATRRVIFLLFLLLFLLASGIILLYAHGYRYSHKHRAVVQTGILFADARPRVASVILNGQTHSGRLPLRFTHLIPGTYNLIIEKDGYHAWEKNIMVRARETAFATDITLWKKEEADSWANIPYLQSTHWLEDRLVVLSRDEHEIALYTIAKDKEPQEMLRVPVLKNTQISLLHHPTGALSLVEITENGQRIIWIIRHDKNEQPFTLPRSASKNDAVFFSPQRTDILYLQEKQNIVQYNLDERTKTVLTTGRFLAARGDILWTLNGGPQGYGVYLLHLLTKQKTFQTAVSPDSSPIPVGSDGGALILYDAARGALLYAADNPSGSARTLPIVSSKRPDAVINDGRAEWLIVADSEVWLVKTSGAARLVERSGQPIREAAFLGDRPYLILERAGAITIVELNDRGTLQTWELTSSAELRGMSVHPGADKIAFIEGDTVYVQAIR